MRVAARGQDLENAFAKFEDRDVECASAEIVDGDRALLLPVEAVRERCGGRLIDNSKHVEAGNTAGILCCLPLCIVEIGGHRNDSVFDFFTECRLGVLLQLAKNKCGNFW